MPLSLKSAHLLFAVLAMILTYKRQNVINAISQEDSDCSVHRLKFDSCKGEIFSKLTSKSRSNKEY